MAYNWALHNSNMALLAAVRARDLAHRIDIQNIFRYANATANPNCKKKLTAKQWVQFKECVYGLLDWDSLLGVGFTKWNPEKLDKYLEKYSSKKYLKLQKYILKNYDDNKDMSEKELKEWCDDMLNHLSAYILLVKQIYLEGAEKLFTKFDSEYYNYAKEEFDIMCEEARQAYSI